MESFSPDLKELLEKMLEKNPEKRLSINEIFETKWVKQ